MLLLVFVLNMPFPHSCPTELLILHLTLGVYPTVRSLFTCMSIPAGLETLQGPGLSLPGPVGSADLLQAVLLWKHHSVLIDSKGPSSGSRLVGWLEGLGSGSRMMPSLLDGPWVEIDSPFFLMGQLHGPAPGRP